MWNPSSRNAPNQSQIRDNRGSTSRERILSGSRCSGNCPFPPLSPIRLDHLPLLESMTPRLLGKRYKTERHAVKPKQDRGSPEQLTRNPESYVSETAGRVTPTYRSVSRPQFARFLSTSNAS